MNDLEIIVNEVLAVGLYSEEEIEEIEEIIGESGCLPLHTFAKWRDDFGMKVKEGGTCKNCYSPLETEKIKR